MNRLRSAPAGLFLTAVLLFEIVLIRPAYAVVGQAERWDEFDRKDLEEFHDNIMNEERKRQIASADELTHDLKTQEAQIQGLQGAQKAEAEMAMDQLRKQLLTLPKRDRYVLESDGQYIFDSNVNRVSTADKQMSDSIFTNRLNNRFDLSGKKTDLRFEVGGAKQWNIAFPQKDYWNAEERIRYRRRYFKKVLHSVDSAIARQNSKTVEINKDKVRWDSHQTTAFNYAFSRKLSLNTQLGMVNRYFQNEAFDQDSSWEIIAAPSFFWNFTPKSRISGGYKMGINRIHSKTGDADSHEIHAGYFGKISRKSSASLDLAFTHQNPRSRDTAAVNSYTLGAGYIWQMTGKTQVIFQAIHNFQNTSSDTVGPDNLPVKTDVHYTNDSLSVSFNSRLTRKITGILTLNGSNMHTSVPKGADKDQETSQFSFPISLTLHYFITRWMTLTTGYTFAYRLADERNDEFRDHSLLTEMHLIF